MPAFSGQWVLFLLTQPGSTGVGEVPESSWYTVAVLPRNCVELLSRSFLRQPILRCVLPTLSKVTFTKTALFAPALQVEEALTIKNTDIAKELCLPPVKLHCSSESAPHARPLGSVQSAVPTTLRSAVPSLPLLSPSECLQCLRPWCTAPWKALHLEPAVRADVFPSS